jgi:hypothetical protein
MDQLCIDKELSETACSLISFGLYFGYFLFGVATIAAIVLPFLSTLKNPKVLVRAGIGIGILAVIFIISFAISGDEVTAIAASQGVTATGSKMIGAGLIMFYITLIGAALGLVYSEVSKALK